MQDKNLLGGKGANLAEMCRIGLRVPPGFTLPTTVSHALRGGRLTDDHVDAIRQGLAFIEEQTGRKLGDAARPLLVSVRSGARVSTPGMMDTVLNLGLNRQLAEAWEQHDEPRLVWDAYRRLLAMFGDVVLGLGGDDEPFGPASTSSSTIALPRRPSRRCAAAPRASACAAPSTCSSRPSA